MCRPAAAAIQDRRYLEAGLPGGVKISYTLLPPVPFDPNATYPAVLFLAGGTQNETMVSAGMGAFIDDAPGRSRWIVVAPAAPPDGRLLFEGHEAAVFGLMDLIEAQYRVESKRFHLAGVSNGGKAAFRLAVMHPERFASLVGFPAFPPERSDFDRLERLRGLKVTLFVGEKDSWVMPSRATFERLRKLGGDAMLRVMPGEDHGLGTLRGGAAIFEALERARQVSPPEAHTTP
jgi:predicted peptidase